MSFAQLDHQFAAACAIWLESLPDDFTSEEEVRVPLDDPQERACVGKTVLEFTIAHAERRFVIGLLRLTQAERPWIYTIRELIAYPDGATDERRWDEVASPGHPTPAAAYTAGKRRLVEEVGNGR